MNIQKIGDGRIVIDGETYVNENRPRVLSPQEHDDYKNLLKQGQSLPIDRVVDTKGQLITFSKFLLDRSYVRGKYYPETLVKLFKGK